MTYRIAFGVDTGSLEDPDQLVLMSLPDECAEMESEELLQWINENKDAHSAQPLVGLNDVKESLELILGAEIPDDADLRARITESLIDAFVNNTNWD